MIKDAIDFSGDTRRVLSLATSSTHHTRRTCRVCGSDRLRLFLSLGPMPLANSFLRSPDEFEAEQSYPLDAYFCENCSLVQLLDVVDPRVLFSRYIYVTGTSDTIAEHNVQYARTMAELLRLGKNDLVVEVASNDGSLLRCFRPYGVRTLGIEPASNIAEIASANGVETVNRFFNSRTAEEVRASHGVAKAVIGNNVLAHVDQVTDFLNGCRELLAPGGVVAIEVPYLRDLLDRLEYDTIYHEHLSYFSATALLELCEKVGLALIRLEKVRVHGGSLRMYAGRPEDYGGHAQAVLAFAQAERRDGLDQFSRYAQFAEQVARHRDRLINLLGVMKAEGKNLAAYGAPAKGNTLLNYCRIDTSLVPYAVDKSPLKVGMYTPGMHLPVLPVSTLVERQPDYVLILAWNFAEEIIRQQHEYLERGGRFIVPLPEPRTT